ncbi:unnamed protein product [Pleuronectes platessa]|uniref:Uncharacterized protein n=1 Tax=Pleuronectes platessa TaxID=8262 RepID=A0A9N7YSJ6_PLEPL|nr:unnamed protein product [Pleuronectes platessa]
MCTPEYVYTGFSKVLDCHGNLNVFLSLPHAFMKKKPLQLEDTELVSSKAISACTPEVNTGHSSLIQPSVGQFRALLKDTSAYGLEELRFRTADPLVDDPLDLLRHSFP